MPVNSNFIASAGWGLQNATGQALTLGIKPVSKTSDQTTTYTGWQKVEFNPAVYDSGADGISSISPAVTYTNNKGDSVNGVKFFRNFIQRNPVHITKMNVRASSLGVMPTNITILTPNIFTGQFDRQVINVTADTTMYQNQSNIVTIGGLDVFISRDSVIEFGGSFSEANAPTLNIDITIDKYLSLEKSLYENMQQLSTATGQMQDFSNVAENAAARLNPSVIQATVNSDEIAANAARTLGASILQNVKGTNSRGNR